MINEKIFSIAHYAEFVILIFLIILSVVSIGLILERYFSLKKLTNESARVRNRLKLALQSNSPEDVEDLAKDPTSIEGRAAGYALKHMRDSGNKGVEEIFNTFALLERPEIEKYLSFLATIASNAPYVGLLGTVLGIMKAFNDLALAPEAGQQTVMAGISSALIATAAGLFVAIPAVIFYNYFNKQVRGIFQSLESVKELTLAYAKKKGM
ncbi:MAG: MotA/TolQ/ExbB proton channel family protein [Pseudobdellovibrionaceae bacterium]